MRPWATVVLSGAATVDQLQSNLRASELTELDLLDLPVLAETPTDYWARRSSRPWQ
jgi:aryl-alcohol dehydrogenase-like predicted oxidoreductase